MSVVTFVISHNDLWPAVISWLLDFPVLGVRLLPVTLLLTALMYGLMRRSAV